MQEQLDVLDRYIEVDVLIHTGATVDVNETEFVWLGCERGAECVATHESYCLNRLAILIANRNVILLA
jgi:hypothetical protein